VPNEIVERVATELIDVGVEQSATIDLRDLFDEGN